MGDAEPEWGQEAVRRNAGDKNLGVRFEMVPCKDAAESLRLGRPVYKDVEYIRISIAGNRLAQVHRPVREGDKQRFHAQYSHWKSQNRNIVDGTPLAEWPPLTRSQVEELRYLNITTVEQLASLADGAASQFLGGQALKQKARDFLAQAKDGAHVGQMREELLKRDNEAEVMRRQLAEQAAAIEKLSALVDQQGKASRKQAGG